MPPAKRKGFSHAKGSHQQQSTSKASGASSGGASSSDGQTEHGTGLDMYIDLEANMSQAEPKRSTSRAPSSSWSPLKLLGRLAGSAAGSSMGAESATPEAKRPDAKPTPPGVASAKAEAELVGPPPLQRGQQRPAEAGTEPAAALEQRILFPGPQPESPTRKPVALGTLSASVFAPTPTTGHASRGDGPRVTRHASG